MRIYAGRCCLHGHVHCVCIVPALFLHPGLQSAAVHSTVIQHDVDVSGTGIGTCMHTGPARVSVNCLAVTVCVMSWVRRHWSHVRGRCDRGLGRLERKARNRRHLVGQCHGAAKGLWVYLSAHSHHVPVVVCTHMCGLHMTPQVHQLGPSNGATCNYACILVCACCTRMLKPLMSCKDLCACSQTWLRFLNMKPFTCNACAMHLWASRSCPALP